MEDFGSEFDNGSLKKKYEEPSVHYLQGICGSAYAVVREYRPADFRYQQNSTEIDSELQ
ncbi:Hypothetical predicted protein, partial [Mytilus galloprovincialis]